MRRKTVIANRGRWSSLSLFRQIHLEEGIKPLHTQEVWTARRVCGHKDALMQCRCCCTPLELTADHAGRGGWPKGPHTSLPHVTCGRRCGYSSHLTLMAVTRFREFDAEDMVLITSYWLTGPMYLDRSVLQDWLTD